MCPARYRAGGSLLHCLSTLTYAMGQISALSHTEAAVLGMKTFLVHGIRRISAPCLGVFHASAYLPIPFAFCLRRCFSHVHISAYADPPTMCRMPASLHTRYISVALSLESPPPDVIRHPALWSPDFPRSCPFVCMTATTCCPLISN